MKLRTAARVQKYIEERDLLKPGGAGSIPRARPCPTPTVGPGDHLVLGVSGGPDSLCLLDLLHTLASIWNLTLDVAHLNHGLRPEAAAEAEFVRAQAEQRHLAFHTETVDTSAYARAHKCSIEEAARELRYAFLARVARSVSAQLIAVAHNADDQAETVLMHFLRGSGVGGLRGMLPKTEMFESPKSEVQSQEPEVFLRPPSTVFRLFIIRPLLTTSRAEIEAYCLEHQLQPVQDATNLDTTYFRNRLRHKLLPELEKYNPNIREVLQRTAEVTAGEYEILRGVLAEQWTKLARFDSSRVTFNRKAWLALKLPEQRSLLREAVRHLRPELRNVDFTPLERAAHFSRTAASGRSCDLLGGLRLSVSPKALTVSAWNLKPELDSLPLLNLEGQLVAGWRFVAETLGPGEWSLEEVIRLQSQVPPHGGASQSPKSKDDQHWTWEVTIDATRIQAPLYLRARLPGDRFQPLGMGGHSLKVSDFMINIKIESVLRDRWPIVVCDGTHSAPLRGTGEIVWLAGLRLDERFKVTPATKTVMRLRVVKDE